MAASRWMSNAFRGEKPTAKFDADDVNLDKLLGVIDGRDMVRKGVPDIIVDIHHLLTVIN